MDLTLAGAAIAGLATSLHCAGMCGPLACATGAMAKSESERMAAASVYHAARLSSYTVLGGICGAVGKEPIGWFFKSPAMLLPWALVAVLVLLATGLEKKIPRPAFITRLVVRTRFKAQRAPLLAGAGLIGVLTPFLPCGPLYAMLLALLAAGSAARGAEVALAFGIGTVPLLWVAQRQFHRLRTRVSPLAMGRIRRALALLTASVLVWRMHDTLPFAGLSATTGGDELPSCCHGSVEKP